MNVADFWAIRSINNAIPSYLCWRSILRIPWMREWPEFELRWRKFKLFAIRLPQLRVKMAFWCLYMLVCSNNILSSVLYFFVCVSFQIHSEHLPYPHDTRKCVQEVRAQIEWCMSSLSCCLCPRIGLIRPILLAPVLKRFNQIIKSIKFTAEI